MLDGTDNRRTDVQPSMEMTPMTTSPRESARIYAFVPRSRLAATGQQTDTMSAKDRGAHQPPLCDFGGGWYHDAAIKEVDRPRKS